jgi:hypothetical protein
MRGNGLAHSGSRLFMVRMMPAARFRRGLYRGADQRKRWSVAVFGIIGVDHILDWDAL